MVRLIILESLSIVIVFPVNMLLMTYCCRKNQWHLTVNCQISAVKENDALKIFKKGTVIFVR